MTTLFDSTRTRKPARRPSRVFAQGVPVSDRRQPYSSADLAWWAEQNAGQRGPSDAELEQLAGVSRTLDCLEAGFAPF